MRDPITDAAQDPSCLLCLTPDRGGSWWSRLRPPTPRVFSTSAYWPGFVSAFNSNGIKNYHFSIKFSLSEMPSRDRVLFGNQMALGEGRFMLVLSSKGKIQVQDESSWSGMVEHPISGTGKHTVMIKIAESSGRIMIDGVEYAVSVSRTAPILTIAFSNFPGTISSILLESDSGTLWQAAYSDLYDTSNPWPSPVPRNFAEEPEAWRDLMAVIAAATETDWSFKIRYNLNSADGSQRIFSPGNNTGPIAVFWSSEGILYLRTIGGNGTIIQANPAGDPTGTHTVEIIAASGLYSIIYDGKTVHSVQDTPTLPRSSAEEVIQSGMNGTILYAEFSCGKAVWRYPSEAERVRLITKTNVRTDRGAFEAADETQPARVDTALDLRGKVSSYTVVVDFEAAEFPETTTVECHQELAGQGGALIGSSYPPICLIGYYLTSSGSARLQLSQEVAGGRHVVNATLTGRLSGRHICCGVVEVDPASPLTASTLYLDGVRIGNASIYAVPTGNAAVNARCFSIAGHSFTGGWPPYTGKVYSGLLFDRALSAAEIAALTPKKQPLSWAGIRDVVRRGRAQRYFAVGDVLTVATPRWTIEYEVTGFDQVEPADAALTHSMTLLPVRLVTNLQFDAPEPGNPDANRAQYGCNRWDWSAIRQWLNSAAAPGEWWTAQHEYDAAPAYAATLAGFMADLPADFLNAVAPARLTTALPNADGGGSVETVDRFWLPSRTEIFGVLNGGIAEGMQMTKYIDATDADRIKYNAAGNSASWYLRSAHTSQPHYVAFVERTGIFSTSFLVSRYVLPACIIA